MSPLHALIPLPDTLVALGGEWTIPETPAIAVSGPAAAHAVGVLLADYLREDIGHRASVHGGDQGAIRLVQTGDPVADAAGFLPEAYELSVTDAGVLLRAVSAAGLARGVQTLRQLLPLTPPWTVPCVRISDAPAFRWRGLHLDVVRHFFSVDDVCRLIDQMALHRFSTFHWHLTDDQGWRIAIAARPRLTAIGAQRGESLIGDENARPRRYDGIPHGGFYTPADIRRVLAHAAARHIAVIPEIDLPGHMQAAVAAYPELGYATGVAVRTHWGISQHVLRATPATLDFLREVLGEVMDLFPGRFIHLGGDEVPTVAWSESAEAQRHLAAIGGSRDSDLHAWFMREAAAIVTARGRRVIGWDEIVEVGLPPDATVMSWRGEQGGIHAARAGHDVVMAPGSHTYFDHYQSEQTAAEPLAIGGFTSCEKVYAYEPVPRELEPAHRAHVLGAQGQLWSEYIPDRAQLDRMAWPRAAALAEVLWTPAGRRGWPGFQARLSAHRARFAALGILAHPRP